MITETEDYKIDCNKDKTIISGILRLPSPSAYETAFTKIIEKLEKAAKSYTIDIRKLTFLNSSGITSLARLILIARSNDLTLTFKGSKKFPWQQKSIGSLQKLWKKVKINLS